MLRSVRDGLICLLIAAGIITMAEIYRAVEATERTIASLPAQMDATIAREMDATRAALRAETEALRGDLAGQVAAVRGDLRAESAAWRIDTVTTAQWITDATDARLASIEETLAAKVTESVAGIRADVRPVLAEAHEALSQTSGTIAVLRPQALGLIAAAKVTAGDTAQTMRAIKAETPVITQNISRTTDNVERLTRPDRWPIRALKLIGPFVSGWILGEIRR